MTEYLNVFDSTGKPLDPAEASIDDVHAHGLWHMTFACWLVNPVRRTVVIQKRGLRNRIDPGSFDASASGHLAAGETPEHGWRELREELGVDPPSSDRLALGAFRNCAVRGSYINNEFCHVFLARWQGRLPELVLQAGEVAGCAEVQVDDALALFGGSKAEISARTSESCLLLRQTDMCNHNQRSGENGYYLKVMQAAADFLVGRAVRCFPPL